MKKKDFLKTFGTVLALMIAVLMMVSCGRNGSETSNPNTQTESENGTEIFGTENTVESTESVDSNETEETTEDVVKEITEEGMVTEETAETEDSETEADSSVEDTEEDDNTSVEDTTASNTNNNTSVNNGGSNTSANAGSGNTTQNSGGGNTGSGNASQKPSDTTNTGSNNNTNTNTNTGANNGSTGTENSTESNNPTPSTPVPQTSKEAFDLINAERVKLGLEPAVWDEECERIALIRAQEIYDLGSKISSEAHDGFDKFWLENIFLTECVAWGYTTAGGVVSAWMDSDSHRGALMAEHYTKLAIARCGGRWVAINCLVVE